MTTAKSGTDILGRTRRQAPGTGKTTFSEAEPLIGASRKSSTRKTIPKIERRGSTVAGSASTLLQRYEEAVAESRAAGKPISFRVEVDPRGKTVVTPFGEASLQTAPAVKKPAPPDPDLETALSAARARGRLRAAEILDDDDMLSAEEFAKLLGTTRVTVNAKRQSGQILGLEGAKRGFRFPVWQLDAEGKPYAVLAKLHERLGGPWAVYRFLAQPHDELDGLTGRAALERGMIETALEAAESIGRDFG